MPVSLGYACINTSLHKNGIYTNRGMIKKTFDEKGLSYVSELVIQNLVDLIKIINWNHNNNINVFRISSSLFPWMSEYEISDLPNFEKIKNLLKGLGQIATKFNQRLTFHPGPFNVLASKDDDVVQKTVKELNQHSELFNLMGFTPSFYNAINIHIGGRYDSKEDSLKRFVSNYHYLNKDTRARLTIENDDKESMYSVKDLVFIDTVIPIVFDYFHHSLHSDHLTEHEALLLAKTTWVDYKQLCHYSSSRMVNEDVTCKSISHADYIYEKINDYDLDLDIELEAKCKEEALILYRKNFK